MEMEEEEQEDKQKMTVEEAGRMGGEATARTHDREFYEEIGREGGEASPTKFQPGDPRAREAGRKGGQSRGMQQGDQEEMEDL